MDTPDDQKMSKINSVYLVALAAFIVGGIAGYSIGNSSKGSEAQNIKLEAQIERAKNQYPPMTDVRTLTGVVKNINGSSITLEVAPPPNPFEEWSQTRTVSITGNTKITIQEKKDPQTYQKEVQEYQRNVQEIQKGTATKFAPGQFPTPPDPFTIVELSLAEVKEGTRASVKAASNIKDAKSFEAIEITVLEKNGI